ncbi:MAG TPA: Glu/Leu/Phe/Val dehydrogenase dimerization domain-containing protein [Alphaproteobacteria bacterium]|nr:Glu/Leu/Phe/Val dehydrogenase dimerization domain-containing protein [Alphaproteobacteria bacterium]
MLDQTIRDRPRSVQGLAGEMPSAPPNRPSNIDECGDVVSARRDFAGHEEVVFRYDKASGLKAIIAIHSRALGPAFGGCRMFPYASEGAALRDALRLSRAMTYKAAMAGVAAGGGKSVIIGDPATGKSEALLRAMGRFVASLGGRYVVGPDAGTTPEDMRVLRDETCHVTAVQGQSGGNRLGNTSPASSTAYGVLIGMTAAARHALGRNGLDGVRVAIQGLGSVGFNLARRLKTAGAQLWVSDIDDRKMRRAVAELGALPVAPEDILSVAADILAPCALGDVINDATLPLLSAKVIAGSANNQLAAPEHGDTLAARGILYAPDYVINAGGLIHAYHEHAGSDRRHMRHHVANIREALGAVFELARREGISTAKAADILAERRLSHGRLPLGEAAVESHGETATNRAPEPVC